MKKNKIKVNVRLLNAAFSVVAVGIFYTADAHAAEYRVQSWANGGYGMYGTMSSPLFGQEIDYYSYDGNGNQVPVYRNRSVDINRSFDSDYKYTSGHSAGSVPGAAEFNRAFVGDSSVGMNDVQAAGYAYTDWGHNHASAGASNFNKVDKNFTAYPQINGPMAGESYSDYANPIDVQYHNEVWTSANSQWEELYQISGGTGTGTVKVGMHVDGMLSGALANGDSAYMDYRLTSFNNDVILQVYAGSYLGTDWWDGSTQNYWYTSIYSNGEWQYDSGTGDLTIDQLLEGEYVFNYGDPLYLNSKLNVSTYGNGKSDFANTVTMENLVLPENALVYALSGTSMSAYNASFAGSGRGTLCTSLECVNGGFSGGTGSGGGSPVPVPAAFWLFASGLLATGFGSRRKSAIT